MTVPSFPPRAPAPPDRSSSPGTIPSRPESIAILVQLAILAVVCQLIAMPGSYAAARDRALPMVKEQFPDGQVSDPEVVARMVAISGIVISCLVLVALVASLMFLLLRGKGWARFLIGWIMAMLAVMMVFEVFGAVFGEAGQQELPTWAMIARIISGVAALGASLAAMHPDTRRYVEQVAAFRRGPEQGMTR